MVRLNSRFGLRDRALLAFRVCLYVITEEKKPVKYRNIVCAHAAVRVSLRRPPPLKEFCNVFIHLGSRSVRIDVWCDCDAKPHVYHWLPAPLAPHSLLRSLAHRQNDETV